MILPWAHWFDKRGDAQRCSKCDAPYHWDLLTNYHHDDDLCVGRQLLQAKKEIAKLKPSVEAWKEAWFQLREIIGRCLWEHHNCPYKIKPNQNEKPNHWLHPNEKYVRVGNLVYQREGVDWKLVGSGASEEAAQAILRFMSF